jgi:hypothetical protein
MQTSQVILNNQTTIGVSGHFPATTKVDVIVEYQMNQNSTIIQKVSTATTPASGDLSTSFTLADNPTTYKVTAQWTGDDGLLHSLQKSVKP